MINLTNNNYNMPASSIVAQFTVYTNPSNLSNLLQYLESNNLNISAFTIQEKDNNYVLDMDLPGYKKEDIKAQLKDGYLTITAQKNTSNDDKDEEGNYIRRERYCGKCSRSFYVGDSIKEEDIKANFNNGILELTFPKEVEQKAEEMKYITID